VQVELSSGEIRNLTEGTVFKAISYPDFVRELIAAGGHIEYARKKPGGE
jgi:3-isopropylmalate/(R)-2-methylmalate dehydratase small subunit